MSLETFLYFFCLLVCVVCLFGIYHLQAAPQPQEIPPPTSPTPQQREVSEPRGTLFSESIDSDFYQTIIRNNLLVSSLGTVLNQKPVPGAGVKLIATFTRKDPAESEAIVQNTATGEQKTVGVGDTIGSYQVLDIQAKQILIEKSIEAPHHNDRDRVTSRGERAVWKRMKPFLLD